MRDDVWQWDHFYFNKHWNFIIDCSVNQFDYCLQCKTSVSTWKVQARCFTLNLAKTKQGNLKKLNTIYLIQHMPTFVLSWAEIKGEGDKTKTPWKIQLSILLNSLCMWFVFLCLRCSPRVVSFPVVFFRGCMLITSPSRCLCFIPLKPSPWLRRAPTSPTSTAPESYLAWPGRAAKGFVKLPPVISPARRIAAEPTHTYTYIHWCGHPLRLHAALLSSAAFISTLAAAGGEFPPRQWREWVKLPVAMSHQVRPLPVSQLWWVFIQLASICQENVLSACYNNNTILQCV